MIIIQNNLGTLGTNSEKAIYGLSYVNDKVIVAYSEDSRDFRDSNASISTVIYEKADVVGYLERNAWEIVQQ